MTSILFLHQKMLPELQFSVGRLIKIGIFGLIYVIAIACEALAFKVSSSQEVLFALRVVESYSL